MTPASIHTSSNPGTAARPVRVQLSRKKGWRMPENTISVARPSIFGNPYRVGEHGDVDACVAQYREMLTDALEGPIGIHRALIRTLLAKARGKNLACWCPLDQPCHADVLLELANGDQQ